MYGFNIWHIITPVYHLLPEDTPMHTAFIRIKVRTDSAESVAAAMRALVAPTLAEQGCHVYSFYRDLDDPSLFLCFEQWASRADLDAHGSTAHVQAFLHAFGPVIERWESNHATTLTNEYDSCDEP